MPEFTVSFDREPARPPRPPARRTDPRRTAAVLLYVLAGLTAVGVLLDAATLQTMPHWLLTSEWIVADFATGAAAETGFAVALVLLAHRIRRGSLLARQLAFGVTGFLVISALYGLVGIGRALLFPGLGGDGSLHLLTIIGPWLIGSFPQAAVAIPLFRVLAHAATRDRCEPRLQTEGEVGGRPEAGPERRPGGAGEA